MITHRITLPNGTLIEIFSDEEGIALWQKAERLVQQAQFIKAKAQRRKKKQRTQQKQARRQQR
ncbi:MULTISPECIES: hypothetical protein [Rodentibacter]|uniref:Uncharacterized protein n=2 Tax=Rodentibacter TaxID=1960084 RepID=A0A1V3J160_9PAST|nr:MULTISPECIES: hypothetical protein [Rodentibacter]OOF38711.1 hypothetical protein BKK47_08625 [Rodentibacter mrazii]OOF45461.1 hypothetical protein BKK51_06485 [Rodentibacter trehalosifermentans]OOF48531.1 hypothetical protein BKK52_05380 [Rodentibacter trehalosifermentans]OOF59637.1 hypothetical protein BKL50_10835 [Rodentibacter pneumotropicus]THA00560.1 hypothetical protein D3M72_08260 [Rodentibacter pneumotropicus]